MKRTIPTSRAYGWVFRTASSCLMIFCLAKSCWPQDFTPKERTQAQAILQDVANDVKTNYYDSHLRGLDWDARVGEAKEKIDQADSLNRALSIIAAVLDGLNDSHTFFLPPPRPYVHDYGYQMQMIADRCYVTRVRPGSDAEAKGLKPGDEIRTVNGYTPTRGDFWRMQYLFWILRPQQSLQLNVRGLDGGERQIDVIPKFRQLPKVENLSGLNGFDIDRAVNDEKRSLGVRYADRGYNLLIVKLPSFIPFAADEVDSIVSKIKNYKAVIFDLRGDGGGSADMVQSLLGGVLDHKVKIGDRVGRGTSKPIETGHHFHPYTGKLAILVDSDSASASEIFARVIQLEKRGVVVGDLSSGKVMEAERYAHLTSGTKGDSYLAYGAEVTVADIIMTDGQTLERRGVVPDAIVLPTASDLASGRDPALAKAVQLLNVTISPEEAGKLFPDVWPKD